MYNENEDEKLQKFEAFFFLEDMNKYVRQTSNTPFMSIYNFIENSWEDYDDGNKGYLFKTEARKFVGRVTDDYQQASDSDSEKEEDEEEKKEENLEEAKRIAEEKEEKKQKTESAFEEVFTKFDANGDGQISKDEMFDFIDAICRKRNE